MNYLKSILFNLRTAILLIAVYFSFVQNSNAQHQNLPLNYQLSQQLEYNIHQQEEETPIHTSFKPINQNFVNSKIYQPIYNDTGKYYYAFTEKLFQKNLLHIEEEGLKLVADPLFNFSYGRTTANDSLYKISNNTRGVRVAGDITNKFSFETVVYETQLFYPVFLDSIADINTIAFGMGRSKTFKNIGHDIAMSTGYASYSPIKQLNIQFGQGKHFIGNGYRSLLLSDNASPAPYLGLSTQLFNNKIQYRSINSWMQSLTRLPATNSAEALFKRKGASFRYLSFIPTNKLQIGIFEGVIYENYKDSIGQTPLSPLFYIPVLGVNSIVNGLSSSDNSLLGLNLNYNITKNYSLYGQYVLDEQNKNGLQIGAKWFNCLGNKNSWIQLEYNTVSSLAYANNTENILQSYTHTNQNIAHPLGASFNELIFIAHFEKNRWLATGKLMFYSQKSKSLTGLGANPLIASDLSLTQDIEYSKNVSFSNLEISYLFNRKTNMQLFANYSYRNERFSSNDSKIDNNNFESFWMFGFRTTLLNYYNER